MNNRVGSIKPQLVTPKAQYRQSDTQRAECSRAGEARREYT